jgi:hypothetical protein
MRQEEGFNFFLLEQRKNGALPLDLACPERLSVRSPAILPYCSVPQNAAVFLSFPRRKRTWQLQELVTSTKLVPITMLQIFFNLDLIRSCAEVRTMQGST